MATEPDARVTVVVMTRDRWPDLRRSLAHHDPPVIVVDNGSGDGTPDLVRRHFPHVEVLELGENRGVTARNVGVRHARTPYVAFADDDSWWEPGALAEAVRVLDAHPRLAVLAARMLVGDEDRSDPICAMMADSPLGVADDLPGPSVLGFLACGAVVRRAAYLLVGGFDEQLFFMGEEEKLSLDLAAAGWGLAYVEQVVARHHPSAARAPRDRRVQEGRNRLLTTLMRRPWPVVGRAVAAGLRDGDVGRAAVVAALPKVPRALARRQVVPDRVERARRLLDEKPEPPARNRRAA